MSCVYRKDYHVECNWTRDELIVAFNLYCKLPFGQMHRGNALCGRTRRSARSDPTLLP